MWRSPQQCCHPQRPLVHMGQGQQWPPGSWRPACRALPCSFSLSVPHMASLVSFHRAASSLCSSSHRPSLAPTEGSHPKNERCPRLVEVMRRQGWHIGLSMGIQEPCHCMGMARTRTISLRPRCPPPGSRWHQHRHGSLWRGAPHAPCTPQHSPPHPSCLHTPPK